MIQIIVFTINQLNSDTKKHLDLHLFMQSHAKCDECHYCYPQTTLQKKNDLPPAIKALQSSLSHYLQPSIHPLESIHPLGSVKFVGKLDLSSQLSLGKRRGTRWTGCQSITRQRSTAIASLRVVRAMTRPLNKVKRLANFRHFFRLFLCQISKHVNYHTFFSYRI